MARKSGVFFIAVLFLLLCGCHAADKKDSPQPTGTTIPAQADFPYTFTDSTGRTVTLTSLPEKVAVLFSSYAEIWKLAGGDIAITVADSVKRGFADDTAALVDDGPGLTINTELLVAEEPDFVIASADMAAQVEVCERLEKAGVPCAAFTEETVADYVSMLKIFTDITGNPEAYDAYGTQLQNRVDKAIADARERAEQAGEPVSVLFIRAGSGDSSTKAKTAKDHFVGIMLNELGAVNIADEAGALSERLSLEHILIQQPDVILIVPQGDEDAAKAYMNSVLQQSGWRDLTSVKNHRVTYLPKSLFHYKPNEHWDEAYTYLTDLLYPEKDSQA